MNRKDRRRQKAATQARGSGAGPPAPAFGADDALAMLTGRVARLAPGEPEQPMAKGFVFSMALAEAVIALDGRRDLAVALKAVAAVYAFAEGLWTSAKARIAGKKIACAKGCSWCCHQQVSLISYEAVAIVEHIRKTWSDERRSALIRRLSERVAAGSGLESDQIRVRRMRCPFLEDGACSIYAVRPFRCRGYNSIDEDVCRWIYEHAEEAVDKRKANALPLVFDGEAPRIFDDAQHALATALSRGGFLFDHLELTRSVLMGLEDEALLARWLAGEDVFAPARIGDKPETK